MCVQKSLQNFSEVSAGVCKFFFLNVASISSSLACVISIDVSYFVFASFFLSEVVVRKPITVVSTRAGPPREEKFLENFLRGGVPKNFGSFGVGMKSLTGKSPFQTSCGLRFPGRASTGGGLYPPRPRARACRHNRYGFSCHYFRQKKTCEDKIGHID